MDFESIAISVWLSLAVIVIALALERLGRNEPQPFTAGFFNLSYTAICTVLHGALVPAVSIVTVAAVNAAGGGLIHLPSSGWGLVVGFVAYLFISDLMEFLFHVAQHRIPALWAMHSFHHSDHTLNASTTNRHFWGDRLIKMMSIYLLIGLLLKPSPQVLTGYTLVSYYHIFCHMNVRVGYGGYAFLLNSPQYHRAHHSSLPEHFDCNFAALFPIFDVLLGTYRPPKSDEYPPTGLDTGRRPSGQIDAMIWPLREWRARNTIRSSGMQQ